MTQDTVIGYDTDGEKYSSLQEMWSHELKDEETRRSWYAKGEQYWVGQEASINGVLGGYPETHGPDIRESKRFIDAMRMDGTFPRSPSSPSTEKAGAERTPTRCLDCGAGIGRVTKSLLFDAFDIVDIVEPNDRLLEAARQELSTNPRAGSFAAVTLQDLEFPEASYDVIWAQWVVLYLPDDDLLAFLLRCMKGLRRRGLICIKENVVIEGTFMVDREDNSISRTDAQMKAIYEKAGLELVHEARQTAWPTNLIPVMMYALRPRGESEDSGAELGQVKRKPASAEQAASSKARCD